MPEIVFKGKEYVYNHQLIATSGFAARALEGGRTLPECDLVFEQAWQGTMDARYFMTPGTSASA
ncbi:MAG: hypothetical protein H7322_14360 [Ramlibacter sp.]|nr:hypothetical protein [Ramlibacter sp.]